MHVTNTKYLLHNLNTVTATSAGNNITDGETVNRDVEEDFNFTCSTSRTLVDITLTVLPDIDVTGNPGSIRDFYLIDVQCDLTGTVFTCTDNTDTVSFTLNLEC